MTPGRFTAISPRAATSLPVWRRWLVLGGLLLGLGLASWLMPGVHTALRHVMDAMARFRAIECRLSYIRATNTGISGFYAPTGEVDEILEVDGKRKEVSGVLRRRVRVSDSESIYQIVGDALAWLCTGFVAAGFLLSLLRIRRKEEGQNA